jgi:hypothetical protein
MTIKTIITCPLGSTCEEVKDGAIHRCMWFIQLAGKDPQTGEDINTNKCSLAWLPILLVENAMTNRGQTAALESFRNESVQQAENLNNILATAASINKNRLT